MSVSITIYRSVESVGEKDLVYCSGLGYIPVVVQERRVLSDEAVNEIAKYTSGPVLREVYTMAPDEEYVKLLKRAGFKLKPLELYTPIMKAIYGSVVEGAWRVVDREGIVANYPPLGYYDDLRNRIFVLDSVSNKLGLVVHENVHYAIEKLRLAELNPIEEAVARFYEVLAEKGVENPVPVKDLPQKLGDEKVVENLRFLVEAFGTITSGIPVRSKATLLFIEAVNLVEETELDPRILLEIVSGKACIENYGLVSRVVEC